MDTRKGVRGISISKIGYKEHGFERKYFCACVLSSKTKNGPGRTRTKSDAQEKVSEQLFTHTSLSDVYE